MSYVRHAVLGSGFTIIALILGNLFAYLFRVFLTRALTLEQYGLFYAVFNFVILFLFFRDMGLNTAITKFIPEYAAKRRFGELKSVMGSILLIQIGTSVLLCLLLLISSSYLAANYFGSPEARTILHFLLIYIILSIGVRFIRGSLIGFKRFFFGSFSEPLNNLLVFGLAVLFISRGEGVLAPVLAYLGSLFILILVGLPIFFSSYNPFRYKAKDFSVQFKSVLMFGFPMMIAALGGQVIGYMDTVMLTFFTDLSTVGIYNVILPSALLFLFFGRGITTVMVPLISELYSKDDARRISLGVSIIYKYAMVAAAPFILAVFAFPDFFLLLFFGGDYVAGVAAFQILLVGVLFFLLSQVNEAVLIGLGQPAVVTKITLMAAALNVILNLLLIPVLGMSGAAIATAASYILMLVLTTLAVKKKVRFKSPVKYWTLALISGIAYLFVISSVKDALTVNKWLEIGISLSAGMVVYLGIGFFTKQIDLKELKEYARLVLKIRGR